MKIAAHYAKMTSYKAGDLYQEALVRAMEGRRNWPRGLPATKFFWGVMRSIAFKALDDDPIAQKILVARMEGARGEEQLKLTGLSPTDYESKCKKIRRRIEKLEAEKK